ncbi:MAG: SRPBCC domain-containing protein [Planctomycetota bacterium]
MSNDDRASRQFEQTLSLAAPREAVWRALAESGEVARWFAPEVEIEPRVGGTVRWEWPGHFDWRQTIEVFEPGRHLRTRYEAWSGDVSRPLFVDWQLEGEGGTTTLRVVHSGFGDDSTFDQEYHDISNGWPVELASLRVYLERHRGTPRQITWARAMVDVDAGEAWQRLGAADALGFAALPLRELEPGAPFAFASGDGERFAGTVVKAAEYEFAGPLETHDHGFLRLWLGGHEGRTMVWLWLATYGAAPPAGLQDRWDAMVRERLVEAQRDVTS